MQRVRLERPPRRVLRVQVNVSNVHMVNISTGTVVISALLADTIPMCPPRTSATAKSVKLESSPRRAKRHVALATLERTLPPKLPRVLNVLRAQPPPAAGLLFARTVGLASTRLRKALQSAPHVQRAPRPANCSVPAAAIAAVQAVTLALVSRGVRTA